MEVYFKDFISEETSLEKLVDDLASVVQGGDDYARTVAGNLPEHARAEMHGRLDRLKRSYDRLRDHALGGARATDKLVREHPYSFLWIVFLAGLVFGGKWLGSRRRSSNGHKSRGNPPRSAFRFMPGARKRPFFALCQRL